MCSPPHRAESTPAAAAPTATACSSTPGAWCSRSGKRRGLASSSARSNRNGWRRCARTCRHCSIGAFEADRDQASSQGAVDYDLALIGAGFAGLTCARAAARRGLSVQVLERQTRAGQTIHTTGLLVKEVAERWEVPSRLTRRIGGVRLYAPSLAHRDLAAPGYYFLATDTPALMAWLAAEARRAGARLSYDRPFRGASPAGDRLLLAGADTRCRYLIGADGANSQVARAFRLSRNRSFLFGLEAEYEGIDGIDPNCLHCFLDSDLAPGYIGWVVPGVNGLAQVGLAARWPRKPDLCAFERKLAPLFDWRRARRVARRS